MNRFKCKDCHLYLPLSFLYYLVPAQDLEAHIHGTELFPLLHPSLYEALAHSKKYFHHKLLRS